MGCCLSAANSTHHSPQCAIAVLTAHARQLTISTAQQRTASLPQSFILLLKKISERFNSVYHNKSTTNVCTGSEQHLMWCKQRLPEQLRLCLSRTHKMPPTIQLLTGLWRRTENMRCLCANKYKLTILLTILLTNTPECTVSIGYVQQRTLVAVENSSTCGCCDKQPKTRHKGNQRRCGAGNG